MEKMRDYTSNTKKHIYLVGVLQASKVNVIRSNFYFHKLHFFLILFQDYCSRLGFDTSNWTLDDAFEYFSKPNHYDYASSVNTWRREDSVKIYDKYSARIAEKLNELKDNPNVDDERANDINNSGKLEG